MITLPNVPWIGKHMLVGALTGALLLVCPALARAGSAPTISLAENVSCPPKNRNADGTCGDTAPKPCAANDPRCKQTECVFESMGTVRTLPYVCIDPPEAPLCKAWSDQFTNWTDMYGNFVRVAWWYVASACPTENYNTYDYVVSAHKIFFKASQNREGQLCGCQREQGGGCLDPETQIQKSDGTWIDAQDVGAGMLLWNPLTKQPVRVAQVVESPETEPLIKLSYPGGSITVTRTHPILTPHGAQIAGELQPQTEVIDAEGQRRVLTAVERLPIEEGQWVINYVLESLTGDNGERSHYLNAGGIASGDLPLQLKLMEAK